MSWPMPSPLMLRRPLFFLISSLCVVLMSGFTGCEENLDATTPDGALHQLRDSVLAKDTEAMLARTSTKTQQELAELHTLLQAQRATIENRYPEAHRALALTAFPKGSRKAKNSGALFAALVAPQLDAMEASPGLRYGLTIKGQATVDGDHAMVPTQSGETIEFIKEDGKWNTTIFLRVIEQNLNRARLNQQTMTENLTVFEELKKRAIAEKAKAQP